jgi:hypothetical protein
LPKHDVPTGTALLSLFQTLGGSVFVAVGQNLFISRFTRALTAIPGLDAQKVAHAGATSLKDSVPEHIQERVIKAYNNSLTRGTFFAALIVACLAVPAALGMEWRSVKQGERGNGEDKALGEVEGAQKQNVLAVSAFVGG